MSQPEQKHETFDDMPRKQWAAICAGAFLQSQSAETLKAVVAGGLMEFIRVAKPIYHGNDFKFEDFKSIFETLQRASQRWETARAARLKAHGISN